MKTNKKFLSAKFLAMFLAGLFVASLATYAATTDISTNLTQAVQYIQKIVLTDNGGSDGATGIILDGDGDVTMSGVLTFTNDVGSIPYGAHIRSNSEDLTLNGKYGLRLTLGDAQTAYINMTNFDGVGANPNLRFITQMTGNDPTVRGQMTFGQEYLDSSFPETLTKRYQISSYGEHHWYTSTGTNGMGIERMTIKDNGNVGIGTTTPSQALDVSGTVNASSYSVAGSGGLTTSLQVILTGNICNSLEFKGGILVATGDCL